MRVSAKELAETTYKSFAKNAHAESGGPTNIGRRFISVM
jgi:hypothetical protein